jgi:hypothetical protein
MVNIFHTVIVGMRATYRHMVAGAHFPVDPDEYFVNS